MAPDSLPATRCRRSFVAFLLAAVCLLTLYPPASEAASAFETIVRHVRQGRYRTARDQLHRFLFTEVDLRQKRRAVYLLGHVHLKLESHREAASYFARARTSLVPLSDYALYNLGVALAGAGRYEEARRALSELIEGEPTSRLKPHAHLQRAEAAFDAGEWGAARADYERLLRGWPAFGDRPVAHMRLGQIFEAKGEEERALAAYKASVFSGPAHPAAGEASERLNTLRASLGRAPIRWTAAEALKLGQALLAAGRPAEALEVLGSAPGRAAPALVRGRVELAAAKAEQALGRRKEAVGRLRRLIARHPRHPDLPEALYLLGRGLWNANNLGEARAALRRLLHRHRKSPFCEQAFYILGRIYEEQGRFARSAKAYRELAAAYPSGELARESLWRMGWNAYRRGRPKEAAETFRRVLPRLKPTDWEDEATYWLARSYEKSGRGRLAQRLYRTLVERYPHTYYGQRAAWRLERGGQRGEGSEPAIRPVRAEAETYDISGLVSRAAHPARERVERARELAAMGFSSDAQRELALVEKTIADGASSGPSAAFALGALYHRSGLYELAIRKLNGPFATMAPEGVLGLDRRFWELYYPRPYLELIERESAAHGLEPALVLGLIRQESAFDADAVSPAGAVGLMQLLPGRAEAERGRLLDPEVNVARGAAHLSRLIKGSKARLVDVLVTYNAGPRRLERWRKRFRGLEEDEFIEAIPFSETRTYVKRVLRNAALYRMLYSPETSSKR